MGYNTDFDGQVTIDPPLNESEISFLSEFATTRRMNRSKGPLYVEGEGYRGQNGDEDVIDGNRPHPDQPGLWCQWVPTDDGKALKWDEGEKFYHAAEWMKYIVENLLAPSAQGYVARHVNEDPRLFHFTFNHKVNGEILAQGDESSDTWMLVVNNNVVGVAWGETVYGKPEPV